jgi:hypothetical protein
VPRLAHQPVGTVFVDIVAVAEQSAVPYARPKRRNEGVIELSSVS